jgi:hypothetical protein
MIEARKSSESTVRGVRRRRKGSGTSSRIKVTYVEFTPEEMAMDCPSDASDLDRYPTITRGDKDWKKFIAFRNGFVRLGPDLRKQFKDERAVNEALRQYLQTRRPTATNNRKAG